MKKFCIFLLCVYSLTVVRSATTKLNSIEDNLEKPRASNGIASYMNDIRNLYRTYQDCSSNDISTCLKLKLVSQMAKSMRSVKDVSIFEGVRLIKDKTLKDDEPIKTEAEIEQSLPRSLDERENSLNGLIVKNLLSFFNTHTLQVNFSSNKNI